MGELHLGWPQAIVIFVILQRLAEVMHSRRNERWLRSQGAIEQGRPGTLAIVIVHSAWLLTLILWVRHDSAIAWPWFGAYAALQVLRVWVLASLGRFWCVKVLTLPAVPLVKKGPYRFLKHPNYAVVLAEVLVLPLVFIGQPGALTICAAGGLAHVLVLGWRIAVEERAIAPRRGLV